MVAFYWQVWLNIDMKISVESISVGDQDKALDFYTRVLGFVKKHDIDMGGGARWLTLYRQTSLKV